MKQILWNLIAWFVAKPAVLAWLQRRAARNPYTVITNKTGRKIYMWRGWIFNRYDRPGGARWPWLPSMRLHHIRLPDEDRHYHDHPWDARTIISKGWYGEKYPAANGHNMTRTRAAGSTHTLKVGQYHRIVDLSPGGVWTLFITWGYEDTWGFLVNGRKIPHKQYIEIRQQVNNAVAEGHLKIENRHTFNNEVERLCELYMTGKQRA